MRRFPSIVAIAAIATALTACSTPPAENTSPAPSKPGATSPSADPGASREAFCAQFREKVDAAAQSLASAEDVFAWGGDFGSALHSVTAAPPAELAEDFRMTTEFYDLVGTLTIANTQPLVDYVSANDIDGARTRLSTTCGATSLDSGF